MNPASVDDYFPQGIAQGKAFLGRDSEIEWLKANISSKHHTLLLAPRRYGKTSLAINTLEQMKIPYVFQDLYIAISIKSVERKIIASVSDLLLKTISRSEQLLTMAQHYFKTKKKKWSLGFKGIASIELIPDSDDDPAENILTALNLLEHVLKKKEMLAVLFLDEIQELYDLEGGKQIQAAIRHFAQASKHLILLFSGSSRKTLLMMFDEKSQPMYELCDRIILERIEPELYKKYLHKVSSNTWDTPLDDKAMDRILELTESHPKRVYNLCYYLWRLNITKKTPKAAQVDAAWDYFVKQRLRDTRSHIAKMSAGQIKVLTLLALGKTKELTGKNAQIAVNMAGASISKTLNILETGDYIEQTDHSYRIIDPLISFILREYESSTIC